MTRQEHLDWAKKRAVEYATKGDLMGAFTSFQSDMTKHPETKDHMALEMLSLMFIGGQLNTPREMQKFIEDFN
jgi:hypothetical protein